MNSDTKIKIWFVLILLGIVIFSKTATAIVPILLSDQGTDAKLRTTGALIETGNLTVEIWDSSSGGNKIWEYSYTNAIVNGSWNVMLGELLELNLTYGEIYYKDYKINNDDINFTNGTGQLEDRKAWYSPLGEINKTFIENRSNVFVDILGDTMTGDLIVKNTTGKLFFVNTTGQRVEIWNPNEGANDYVSVYHDGSNGYFTSTSGSIEFKTQYSNLSWGYGLLIPGAAGSYDLGISSNEWRRLFLGEDASSGVYFGLDQDARTYYNTSQRALVTYAPNDNVSLVTPQLKIWDDSEGANDYVSIYHDGTDGIINTQSGEFNLKIAGTEYYFYQTGGFFPTAANSRQLGGTANEWKSIYFSEDANSGAYFGLDQDARLYYNETSEDALILETNEFRVWDDARGEGDYVIIKHDGTDANIESASGRINIGQTGAGITETKYLYPNIANTYPLGSTTNEWNALYLGEDASSGAYFGLNQDWRMYYNETSDDALWLEGLTDLSIATTDLKIWDDAKGTNDYMSVYHDAANGYITTGSGGLYLSPATSSVYSRSTYPQSANNYQLGSTIGEWKNLYLGEDALSGAYFGLDQDWRMYYNETSADALILNNGTADVMAWKGGNVGIGTTAPGEALQVKGNIKILSEAAGTGKAYLLGRTVTESTLAVSAGANQYAGGSVAGDIILRTEATSQALILNSGTGASTLVVKNGKVGIGQTSPAMGLHVGTGSSSHSLTNVNDNYITGKLEVDGTSYFDGQTQHYAGLWMGDNDVALFGDGNDFSIMWGTGQATENTAILGLGNTAKSIIVTANSFRTDDFDHPAQTNPTIFVQSNEDPDNDNTKWGSVSHDNTSFVIDSGSDNITLDDSTNVAGDLSLGDNQVGTELLVIEDNGTHVVIDSVNEVYIKNNLSFNTYYGEMWYYNGTGLSLDFAVADKYYNMSYNESFVNGFVFDDAKDRLNASYGGAYRACYFASGSGQNNHEYRSSVLVNDIEQTKCRAEKDLAAGEDVTTMTGCCLLELAADDTVGVGVADVGATGAGTLFSTNLNIVRVGH